MVKSTKNGAKLEAIHENGCSIWERVSVMVHIIIIRTHAAGVWV